MKRGQTYMDRALTITREATDYDQALEALLAAEKLDPQQARRMMEEMDRDRREEEARLFPGGSGRAVERDW